MDVDIHPNHALRRSITRLTSELRTQRRCRGVPLNTRSSQNADGRRVAPVFAERGSGGIFVGGMAALEDEAEAVRAVKPKLLVHALASTRSADRNIQRDRPQAFFSSVRDPMILGTTPSDTLIAHRIFSDFSINGDKYG